MRGAAAVHRFGRYRTAFSTRFRACTRHWTDPARPTSIRRHRLDDQPGTRIKPSWLPANLGETRNRGPDTGHS